MSNFAFITPAYLLTKNNASLRQKQINFHKYIVFMLCINLKVCLTKKKLHYVGWQHIFFTLLYSPWQNSRIIYNYIYAARPHSPQLISFHFLLRCAPCAQKQQNLHINLIVSACWNRCMCILFHKARQMGFPYIHYICVADDDKGINSIAGCYYSLETRSVCCFQVLWLFFRTMSLQHITL